MYDPDNKLLQTIRETCDARGQIIAELLPGIMADIAICDALIRDALDKIGQMREMLGVHPITVLDEGTDHVETCPGITRCGGCK